MLTAELRRLAARWQPAPAVVAHLKRAGVLIALLALFGWTTWLHLLVSLRFLEWDSHIWVLMGRWWLDGIWPYRDAWELKPPGIFLYIAGVFALLPHALWSLRLTDWLLSCATTVIAFCFLRRQTNLFAAFLGAGAWSFWSVHDYLVLGNIYTEQYAAGAMWLACWLATTGRPTATGAAAGLAVLFKHPA